MRRIYTDAVRFLIAQIPAQDPAAILAAYLTPPDAVRKARPLSEVYRRLLHSAQNSNMKSGVIGGSIDGFDNLKRALFSFNPKKVQRQFGGDPQALLDHITTTLQPRGKLRTGARSIWPKYCKTILSAATFLSQFRDGDDFLAWAEHLYSNEKTMAALPLMVACEIEGIGYPLACDFLKEFGFTDFAKPDVHVNRILAGLGVCPSKPSPYQVQRVIAQIAKAARVPAYDVDKVLWLIGSGRFYKHADLGRKGQIGRMTDRYLALHRAA